MFCLSWPMIHRLPILQGTEEVLWLMGPFHLSQSFSHGSNQCNSHDKFHHAKDFLSLHGLLWALLPNTESRQARLHFSRRFSPNSQWISWLKLNSLCAAFFKKSLLNWNLDCNVVTGVRGKKRKHESIDEDDKVFPSEKVVNIQIPLPLKKQLVDDNECITQLDRLVKLPRSPSVHEILNKYYDWRAKKERKTVDTVAEIVKGLCHYFDKALPTVLLYKNERQQYKEVIVDNISPSSVYGAEHLLRLFVKLPEMLSDLRIQMETLTQLRQISHDFLRFLQTNQSVFFLSNYLTTEGLAPTVDN